MVVAGYGLPGHSDEYYPTTKRRSSVFHGNRKLISGMSLVLAINLFLAIPVGILIKTFPEKFYSMYSPLFWYVSLPFFGLISLTQFVYISPLIIWLLGKQQTEFMKGVLIGAVITFFLNGGGCFLVAVWVGQ